MNFGSGKLLFEQSDRWPSHGNGFAVYRCRNRCIARGRMGNRQLAAAKAQGGEETHRKDRKERDAEAPSNSLGNDRASGRESRTASLALRQIPIERGSAPETS